MEFLGAVMERVAAVTSLWDDETTQSTWALEGGDVADVLLAVENCNLLGGLA